MAFNIKPTDPAPKTDAPKPVHVPIGQFEDFDKVPELYKENKYQDKVNELAKTYSVETKRSKATLTLIGSDEKTEKVERDLVRKAANVIKKGARTRVSKKHPKTGANAPSGMQYMVFWLEEMTNRSSKKTEPESA